MLDVRQHNDGFVVFDTEADEPVMLFVDRRSADQLIAEMQVQELHARLARWSPHGVLSVY
jgi:hypothetical protein